VGGNTPANWVTVLKNRHSEFAAARSKNAFNIPVSDANVTICHAQVGARKRD